MFTVSLDTPNKRCYTILQYWIVVNIIGSIIYNVNLLKSGKNLLVYKMVMDLGQCLARADLYFFHDTNQKKYRSAGLICTFSGYTNHRYKSTNPNRM